ncbi:MAG: hypothetical protein IKS51_08155 [Erysipelotrichaceae bacterium]|nr:hypothetical protein [Erysipelotrichaceae bacterium]
MRNKEKFIFYLETFLLTVSFVLVIVVLSSFLVKSSRKTVYARDLTNAVCLSENVAETTKAADSFEELYQLLNENDNAYCEADKIVVTYDKELKPVKDGRYHLTITYHEEGEMVTATIDASVEDTVIYDLELAQYKGGER